MSSEPNDNGVYTEYQTEEIARHNRSSASVDIARCTDGLFRFSVSVQYSYAGFSGPITDTQPGHETYDAAKKAGISELLRRFRLRGRASRTASTSSLRSCESRSRSTCGSRRQF